LHGAVYGGLTSLWRSSKYRDDCRLRRTQPHFPRTNAANIGYDKIEVYWHQPRQDSDRAKSPGYACNGSRGPYSIRHQQVWRLKRLSHSPYPVSCAHGNLCAGAVGKRGCSGRSCSIPATACDKPFVPLIDHKYCIQLHNRIYTSYYEETYPTIRERSKRP
jgi:hypothetical protein